MAIDHVRAASDAYLAGGNLLSRLQAVQLEAELLGRDGRWADALVRLEAEYPSVRKVGSSFVLPEMRARFYGQQRDYHETMLAAVRNTDVLPESVKTLRMLDIVESARAIAMRAHRSVFRRGKVDADTAAHYEAYSVMLSELRTTLASDKSQSGDSAALSNALLKLEQAQEALWQGTGAGNADQWPIALSQPALNEVLSPGVGVLYLYVGKRERFGVLLQRNRHHRFALDTSLPIHKLVKQTLGAMRSPNSPSGVKAPAAAALADALLSPVVDELESIDTLIVIPGAGLDSVPYSALPHPVTGRPLLSTHVVQGANSLHALRARSTDAMPLGRIAAVGDPVTS
ncbi:MAG: CHAT domain-containing protein, partial [Pseudomonadota bacterium]